MMTLYRLGSFRFVRCLSLICDCFFAISLFQLLYSSAKVIIILQTPTKKANNHLLRHQDFLTLTDVEASALWGIFLLFAVDGVIGSILNRSQQHSTNGSRL